MFCVFLKRKLLVKLILKEMLILFFYWDCYCLEFEIKDSKYFYELNEGYYVEFGFVLIGFISILFYVFELWLSWIMVL